MAVRLSIALCVLMTAAARLSGQSREVRVDLADVTTLAQFARAEQSAAAGLWDEAIDALLRAGDLGGERLVPLPAEREIPRGESFQRHITAQRLAQFRLAEIFRLRPETLKTYRRRVDPTAERLIRELHDQTEAAAWEPLLRRYPLSSPAAGAWLRYGESQLEAGNHHLARAAFETLHPLLRTPSAAALPRPQPSLPTATEPAPPGPPAPLATAETPAAGDAAAMPTTSAGSMSQANRPVVPAGRSWWWTFQAAERSHQIAEFDTPTDPAVGAAGVGVGRGAIDRSHPIPGLLTYPDSQWSAADLSARLVATSILEGDRQRAVWELSRLRRLFPAAEGELQGRRGPWHELLHAWLVASESWPIAPLASGPASGGPASSGSASGGPAASETTTGQQSLNSEGVERFASRASWTQFAGGPERRGTAERLEDLAGRPRWSVPLVPVSLPSVDVVGESGRGPGASREWQADSAWRVAAQPPLLLAGHPVVGGGLVAVQDAQGVVVRVAATGAAVFGMADDARLFANPLSPLWLAPRDARRLGAPRFPLAIDGGLLWACVGAPWQSFQRAVAGEPQPPRLIGLNLEAEGRAEASWNLLSPPWGPEWTWEGPPLCVAGRAYVGLRRADTVETQSHIACFDIATGRLRWRRLIAAAHSPRPARSVEWNRHLLTWHEDRLFVHADVGAVACLNPRDGVVEWLMRYPRLEGYGPGSATGFAPRELSPCVVERGVVYVAAADQPALFAIEAATGQLLWVNDHPALRDSEHLLGCVAGRLVAGGRRLAWIDAATGRLLCRFPAETDADGPRGFGRGLFAGDEIWWPSRDRLFVFHAGPRWDGSQWRPRASRLFDLRVRGATGGNLAIADGLLFIAGTDRLYVFGP